LAIATPLDPVNGSTMVVVFFLCLMWVVSLELYYSNVGKTAMA
jgi:hypothetical protein